jgi:hypothetical protein
MANVSIMAAAKAAAGVAGSILAVHFLPVFAAITILASTVAAGVMLPAVWSANPERRTAALAVLQEILRTTRRSNHR